MTTFRGEKFSSRKISTRNFNSRNISSCLPFDKKLKTLENHETFSAAEYFKHFVNNWEKLTNDLFIFKVVQGYEMSFSSKPFHKTTPKQIQMSQEETILMDQVNSGNVEQRSN